MRLALKSFMISLPGKIRVRDWFKRRRWLVRLGLTYILTSLVLTALLLLLVSRVVSGQLVDKTDAANRDLLNQTYLTIDYTLSDVYSEYYQLWRKDSAVQTVLAATDRTDLTVDQEAMITDRLRFTANQTIMVDSVDLLSFRLDRVWSSRGDPTSLAGMADRDAAGFINQIASHFDQYRRDVFFARQALVTAAGTTAGTTEKKDFLTFFFVRQRTDGQFADVLLVNLKRDQFSQLIKLHSDNGFIILVSPSGEIIADTSGRWIQNQTDALFTHPAAFDDIVQLAQKSGSLIASTAIGQSLVTWQKAGAMGFYLLDVTPLEWVYRETKALNRLLSLFFIGANLFSVVIGLWSIRSLYQPLQRLLQRFSHHARQDRQNDEFAILDDAYQQFEQRENQNAMHGLLGGLVTPSAQALFDPSTKSWLGIALMPIQDQKPDRDLMLKISRLLEAQIGVPAVMNAEDCICTLLGGPEGSHYDWDRLRQQLELILKAIDEQSNLVFVAGLGDPVDELADCRTTHRQALVAANQARLILTEHATLDQRIQVYKDIGLDLGGQKDSRQSTVDQVMTIISEQIADPELTVDRIASTIGLSTGYLRQLFKLETGQTVNEYLIDYRIRKACDMLRETDQTAREIALAVGFVDSRYFYTLFKKRTGQTTEQFRQKSRLP